MRADSWCFVAILSPVAVSAETAHRRPVRHRGGRRIIIERLKVARTIDDASTYHREIAGDIGNLVFGAGEEVAIWNDQIGQPWTACVAHVKVDPDTGEVTLKKVTLAMDVGTIVNPDGVRAQIEGSIFWGASLAMLDEGLDEGRWHRAAELR